MALHILFVCTGNICRSPTAERLTRHYAAEHGIVELAASSAGTRALVGHPIHPEASVVLEAMGGDSSHFAARRLTHRIAREADLVLGMTTAHRDAVFEVAPQLFRKAFTLTEASMLTSTYAASSVEEMAALRPVIGESNISDIPDPIGQDHGSFVGVGSQIAELLTPILQQLCARSR